MLTVPNSVQDELARQPGAPCLDRTIELPIAPLCTWLFEAASRSREHNRTRCAECAIFEEKTMYSTQAYQQRLGPVGEHVATYEKLHSQRYVQLVRIPTASKFCRDRFRRSHRAHSNVQQLFLINFMTHDDTTCWNPVKFPWCHCGYTHG